MKYPTISTIINTLLFLTNIQPTFAFNKIYQKSKNHRLKSLKENIDLYYIMLEKHMWQKGQGYTWIYIKNHLSLDLDLEI
jgi:hypothetical protein